MRSRLPSFVSPRPSFFPAASHIKPLGQGSLLLFRRRGGKLFVFELPSCQQTSVKGGGPSLVLVLMLSTASDGTMQSVEGSKRICILLYLRSEIVFCSHLFFSLFPPLFLVLLIKTFTPLLPPPLFFSTASFPSLSCSTPLLPFSPALPDSIAVAAGLPWLGPPFPPPPPPFLHLPLSRSALYFARIICSGGTDWERVGETGKERENDW